MQHLYCASVTPTLFIMPSPRKRIGFLPSEEVHDIIDKICMENEFSQSKVTGLLVEEALRSRGVLSESINSKIIDKSIFTNNLFEKAPLPENKISTINSEIYKTNKKELSEDIKMMHEFIEFKYFKKIMNENKNILE